MWRWLGKKMRASAALALLGALTLFALGVATDEGGVPTALRLSRVVPLLPIASALAYVVVLAQLGRRGEALALEALGADPASLRRPIALAALTPTLLGALALALGLDSGGLYPRATQANPCAWGGQGFECAQAGLQVTLRGGAPLLQLLGAPVAQAGSAQPLLAALVVLSSGLVLVVLAGMTLHRPQVGALALAFVLVQTATCQAIGAQRAPAVMALVLPAAALGTLLWRQARARRAT